MYSALASWFDDAGLTQCETHVTNGFASIGTRDACGERIRFCYGGRCVTGVREDDGPFIAGRTFDMTPSLKANLGCSDLCHLRWRRLGA